MAMKRFSLGLLAKVLYIWLSCIQPSEAQIVSNSVCKWNNSTSTCQQDQQGLIDLLTEAGEAHTFSLFMRCQYASDKSQCNNLSQDTCIWKNGACRISSKKLVKQINSCFYTSSQQDSIIPCKNELVSISNSTTWINQDAVIPAASCLQTVDYFTQNTKTCRLMESALQCNYNNQICEQASSRSNQAYQFISDLRYVMSVSQQDVSLSLSYLERQLDIIAGNLEEYFRCSQQGLQECEELPPLPSTPSQGEEKSIIQKQYIEVVYRRILTVLKYIFIIAVFSHVICCLLLICCGRTLVICCGRRQAHATANERGQAQNLELGSVNATSQNAAQNQVAQIQTAEIIAALPPLEYMDEGENRSEQVCVICLEGLKEGEISTVLPCAHWYHKNCIESWINNKGRMVTCPLCNHPVQQQNNQL